VKYYKLVWLFYPPMGNVGDEEIASEFLEAQDDETAEEEVRKFLVNQENEEQNSWIAFTLLNTFDLKPVHHQTRASVS